MSPNHSYENSYLVTGAAGFIGARFVESCNFKTIPTVSVDEIRFFKERTEHQNIQFGQMIDLNQLFSWLDQHRPKFKAIVHLGAISDTRESNLERLNFLNLEYSKKLWNFSAAHRIPFVYASSAATYGAGECGYDDRENLLPLLKPLNAYGQSKQDFDLWVLQQEREKDPTPPAWSGFKFFNVYGFGEKHKGFMASVVFHAFQQIKKEGKVTLFKSHKEGISDGHQKRDFVFVDDVVEVLHYAASKPIPRGIYNLGTGSARTFLDLAKAVFAALGQTEQIEFVETPISIREKYQYFTEARMERLRSIGYTGAFSSLEQGVRLYVQKLLSLT